MTFPTRLHTAAAPPRPSPLLQFMVQGRRCFLHFSLPSARAYLIPGGLATHCTTKWGFFVCVFMFLGLRKAAVRAWTRAGGGTSRRTGTQEGVHGASHRSAHRDPQRLGTQTPPPPTTPGGRATWLKHQPVRHIPPSCFAGPNNLYDLRSRERRRTAVSGGPCAPRVATVSAAATGRAHACARRPRRTRPRCKPKYRATGSLSCMRGSWVSLRRLVRAAASTPGTSPPPAHA